MGRGWCGASPAPGVRPAIARQNRRLASINKVAEILDVNPRTVRRRIADGTLRAYRVGPTLVKVDLDDVDRILRPIPTGGEAA